MTKIQHKIELLAPAGSREAFIAAVENGADAVYLAGTMFGARQYANNFTDQELKEVITEAHLRGVHVLVTVNTLVNQHEMKQLVDYLEMLYTAGVDAVIVQDIGVAAFIRKTLPDLPMHASTQMAIHNLAGVEFLKNQGFERVVLARELSLENIVHICQNTTIDIEVFAHGALCVCYSGQCLMSSMIGGRSGNRGKCAQPCRLPYQLVTMDKKTVSGERGEYLLSPKDLNTIELMPQLIEAGVRSLKIEGRMKRPEYVATVVRTYRAAIDRYYAEPGAFHIERQEQKDLMQVFNRDFTTGYLQGRQYRQLISEKRPNNRGSYLGRVTKYISPEKMATIKLEDEVAIGDGIEVWVKVGGRVVTDVSKLLVDGQEVQSADSGQQVAVPVPSFVKPGDRVFKTNSAILLEKARATFTHGSPIKRIPVAMSVEARIGETLKLEVVDQDGNSASAHTECIAQQAINRPLTEQSLQEQLGRLGTTVFELRNLQADIDSQVMVPVSEINKVRREAIAQLEHKRLQPFARSYHVDRYHKAAKALLNTIENDERITAKTQLSVCVDSYDKLVSAVDGGADVIIFGGEVFHGQAMPLDTYQQAIAYCHNTKRKIYLSTPRICHDNEIAVVAKQLEAWQELQPDGISVGNLGLLYEVQRLTKLPIHADYPINIFNGMALQALSEWGIASATLSPELTMQQVEYLAKRTPIALECLVHGQLELMVSEYCVVGSFASDCQGGCKNTCRKVRYGLLDRMGEVFPVQTDQYCRMHVFNPKELVMISHIASIAQTGMARVRIEAKVYESSRIKEITRLYREVLDKGMKHPVLLNEQKLKQIEHQNSTRGHYFRGV